MPVTPSTLFMNFEDVTVTPEGGTAISLGNQTSVNFDGRNTQEMFFGANRTYPLLVRNTQLVRTLSISGGDAVKIAQIPFDKPCTITGKILDAVNADTANGGG